MIKVSVVVPTYRSGDGLDRLVASLDAQTLPASEFEVVFVDDGSPDDTWDRLQHIQATRPNVRLERIENSGWPCRPRNIGTDLARGEFVAYMDHDDVLYPDALRGAYEYAVAHGADVVNGKEARTHDATWAIETYVRDEPQSLGRVDQNPLIPMNPHKLYRRAFLDEHGIRFREGGRVMWEDIFFNLLVLRHATVVSTLASVPYYHWYQTPGSGSKGFLRSSPEFWHWLREVFVATTADLPGEAFALPREQLLAHQYRSRLLGSFDGRFAARPDTERDLIYTACRALQADFAPPALDARLNSSGRIRARLLRGDERVLLESLPQHDPGIPGWGELTSMRWTDGRLELEARAEWSTQAGRRHPLRREGGRIVKDLPAEYRAAIPVDVIDVTDEIEGATVALGLRSRASRVTWMAPSTHRIDTTDAAGGPVHDGGSVRFEGTVTAVLDPDALVFGRPLEAGLWDVNVRCVLAGTSQQPRLKATLPAAAVLWSGDLRLAYANEDGLLSVSVGADEGRAVRRMPPDASRLRVSDADGRLRVEVPLPEIDVHGSGSAATSVEVAPAASRLRDLVDRARRRRRFHSLPALVAGAGDTAVLSFDLPRGTRRVRLRLGDQTPTGRRWWTLSVRADGSASLTPGPPH